MSKVGMYMYVPLPIQRHQYQINNQIGDSPHRECIFLIKALSYLKKAEKKKKKKEKLILSMISLHSNFLHDKRNECRLISSCDNINMK